MTPRIEKTDDEWREALTPEQYLVCRKRGTEMPFTGQYWNCNEPGIYQCVCCGQTLFEAEDKFPSGCGWPSFTRAFNEDVVEFVEDNEFGMKRLEVLCARCGAHLGHVFPDGPPPTGIRYCVNSIALKLKPEE